MIHRGKWRTHIGLVSAMAVTGAEASALQTVHAEGTPKPPGPSGAQQDDSGQKQADGAA